MQKSGVNDVEAACKTVTAVACPEFCAGCGAGTAPAALKAVWDAVLAVEDGVQTVSIPCNKETADCSLCSGIPNDDSIKLTAKRDGRFVFRRYPWTEGAVCSVNGLRVQPEEKNGVAYHALGAGQMLEWLVISNDFPREYSRLSLPWSCC